MNIRLLMVEDADLWKKIRLEALQDSPESFGSAYEEEINFSQMDWESGLKKNDIFGVFIDEELVATAAFFNLLSLKTKHRGFIYAVYTKPAYRGKGLAGSLIERIITHAKSCVIQLHLACVTTNLGAVKLYEKHNFKIYGTEPRSIKIGDNYFDEYLMCLDLTKF